MTIVRQLTRDETREYLSQFKANHQLTPEIIDELKKQGFYFTNEYAMEKKYKGYFLVVEFCIGDFCTYPCSKNGHWLLEKKRQNDNFMSALVSIAELENRIDNGQHWTGEED